jgi:hypothetical protein
MPIYSPQTGNPFEDATSVTSAAQQDFVLLGDDLRKIAIANLPFASVAHEHAIDEITGLQIALDGKASANHEHPISGIDGLVSVLDGKASAIHSHLISDVTNLQTTLDDKVSSTTLANTVSVLQGEINQKANTTQLPIWSQSEPINPTNNLTWYELASDSNLKNKWLRINNSWMSEIQKFNLSWFLGEGRDSSQVALDTAYNYWLSRATINLYNTTALTSSSFISARIISQRNAAQTIHSTDTFNNVAVVTGANVSRQLNLLISPTGASNQLMLNINSSGSPGAAQITLSLDYQLVRK